MTALVHCRALAVGTAALLLAITGCGQQRAGAPSGVARAPRTLDLPERVESLASRSSERPNTAHNSAKAAFEEPGGGARIRDLSATPPDSSRDLIREPVSGPLPPAVARREPAARNSDLRGDSVGGLRRDSTGGLRRDSTGGLRSPVIELPRKEYQPLRMPPQASRTPPASFPELSPKPAFADDSLRAPRPQNSSAPRPEFARQNHPQLQPPAARQFVAQETVVPSTRAAMQPVSQRALEISNHAYSLAQRGMLYSARAELIQSLQLVAQALDVQQQTTKHAAALASGLTALKEVQDFAPLAGRPGTVVNVAEIARTHQTPVLKDCEELSPIIAQQQYLAYAQVQLIKAASHEQAASLALVRLGRVQMAMAQEASDPQMQHGPQAMTYYQAALAVDDRNFLAANELAVLMAQYGQLEEARRLLVHSVSIQPQVETWHNLAVVHRRLGESDLAQRAEHERQLLAQHLSTASAAGNSVAWVDPQTFTASSRSEAPWPENMSATPRQDRAVR